MMLMADPLVDRYPGLRWGAQSEIMREFHLMERWFTAPLCYFGITEIMVGMKLHFYILYEVSSLSMVISLLHSPVTH